MASRGLPEARGARGLAQLATETLALGCLFERWGHSFIRRPVQRRQQMAGCEWHCRRVGGRLHAVSYTFEDLEDWIALAREAPREVVSLYRGILGRPDIAEADLHWRGDVFARGTEGYVLAFPAGSYNPLNAWNTVRGAVHLNGLAEAGFEARPRMGRQAARLRLDEAALGQGLLFQAGRDVTVSVMRAARRERHGMAVTRLELQVPEGQGWSLSDLTLPDGEGFTPLGLFHRLAGEGPSGGEDGTGWEGEPAQQFTWLGTTPFLPGSLVRDAVARRGGSPGLMRM